MSVAATAGMLMDIEGTLAPLSYVYDVLFPYARNEAERYLTNHWHATATVEAIDLMAPVAGYPTGAGWLNGMTPDQAIQTVVAEMNRLMDKDVKATGLKQLQGMIWAEGFAKGKLQSAVFNDVPEAFKRWQSAGSDIRIYSSGSITAQQVFFQHTAYGDLRKHLQGYYDTTIGVKTEPSSYAAIARDFQLKPEQISFFSDVPAELEAARTAGMQPVLVIRPGNAQVGDVAPYEVVTSLAEVVLSATIR